MSAAPKAFPVSWDQFHRDCKALAWRLMGPGKEPKWTAIVAITRGGLVPAAIIARELGIRTIETVCIASYHEYKDQGELEVIKGVNADVIKKDGKTYYQVLDVQQWHEGVGRLLKEVQRIKSEGDRAAAERMMQQYAININVELRDEVLKRYEKLDKPLSQSDVGDWA